MSFIFEELFFTATDKTVGSKLFKENLFANIDKNTPLYNNREQFYNDLIKENIIKTGSFFAIIISQADKFDSTKETRDKFYKIINDLKLKRQINDTTYTNLKKFYDNETSTMGKLNSYGGNNKKNKSIRKNSKISKQNRKTMNVNNTNKNNKK